MTAEGGGAAEAGAAPTGTEAAGSAAAPAGGAMRRALVVADRLVARIERVFLATSLTAMSILYLGVVFLRTLAKPSIVGLPGAAAAVRLGSEISYENWAQHLAVYLMIWTGFVGASVATRDRKHLQVDAAEKLFKGKAGLVVQAIGAVVAAGFCGFLGYYGALEVASSRRLEEVSKVGTVPLWVFQAVIPLTAALMAVRFLLTIGQPPPPRRLE